MFVHTKRKLMRVTRLLITTLIICCLQYCEVEAGSEFEALENLQKITVKHLDTIENKIEKYSNRIIFKTEKTLAQPSKPEHKLIKYKKPGLSARLFELVCYEEKPASEVIHLTGTKNTYSPKMYNYEKQSITEYV